MLELKTCPLKVASSVRSVKGKIASKPFLVLDNFNLEFLSCRILLDLRETLVTVLSRQGEAL